MQAQTSSAISSFQSGDSPLVFSEIFSASTSVSNWERPSNNVIQAYYSHLIATRRLEIRNVFNVSSLKSDLADLVPDGIGKEQAINDIHLLADMLTCLFDCSAVGLRLAAINKAMCPRFHVDNIPVRLVTTYLGPGSQWLPNEFAEGIKLGHDPSQRVNPDSGRCFDEQHIKQLKTFDVALLKGSAWEDGHCAAIHRSCDLAHDQWRVLLTLDPV